MPKHTVFSLVMSTMVRDVNVMIDVPAWDKTGTVCYIGAGSTYINRLDRSHRYFDSWSILDLSNCLSFFSL